MTNKANVAATKSESPATRAWSIRRNLAAL